jgi:hypothetical protein
MYLTLEDIKKQLVIEHDEDNDYLMDLAKSAEDGMRGFLGRESLEEITDENGKLPAGIHQALRMLVAGMYAQREPTVSYAQYENATFRILTQPYIKYT